MRKMTPTHITESISLTDFNDNYIREIVDRALRDTISDLHDLGIQEDTEDHTKVDLPSWKKEDFFTEKENDSDHIEETNEIDSTLWKKVNRNFFRGREWTEKQSELDEIIDLAEIGCVRGDLKLKTFNIEKNFVTFDSPFIEVAVNSKRHIIKKSSICWLLENPGERVSTDRLKRFIVKKSNEKTN